MSVDQTERSAGEAVAEVESRIAACAYQPADRVPPGRRLTDQQLQHLRRIAIAALPNAGEDVAEAIDEPSLVPTDLI